MEERRLGPVVGLGTWNTFPRIESLCRTAGWRVSVRVMPDLPIGQSEGGTGLAWCGLPAAYLWSS